MVNKLKIRRVIIFGRVPPPIGGVTVSIKNLIKSLSIVGILVDCLSFKCLFKKYDIAHIHYSNLVKRTLGMCIAKLFFSRAIFTVHGKYLDLSNVFNKISIYLSDGIIVLNSQLYHDIEKKINGKKIVILPSLFSEGVEFKENNKSYFTPNPNKINLLLYSYSRKFVKGEEIYGVEFIINNLREIPEKYNIVLLDISGKYSDLINLNCDRVFYINEVVDFMSLLKQVDVYIRPTCMDGASVAVQEAQLMGVPVLASDVVDRPLGVKTFKYKDIDDFIKKLGNINTPTTKATLKNVNLYIDFCERLH